MGSGVWLGIFVGRACAYTTPLKVWVQQSQKVCMRSGVSCGFTFCSRPASSTHKPL